LQRANLTIQAETNRPTWPWAKKAHNTVPHTKAQCHTPKHNTTHQNTVPHTKAQCHTPKHSAAHQSRELHKINGKIIRFVQQQNGSLQHSPTSGEGVLPRPGSIGKRK